MIEHAERYIALRTNLGYRDADLRRELREFVLFAEDRGATHVRRDDVDAWIAKYDSEWTRRRRFGVIAKFSDFLRAEYPKNDKLVARYAVGRGRKVRLIPYVYETEETVAIMGAFATLRRSDPQLTFTLQTIIGLLAATGMRLGETLALRRLDYRGDRLFVRYAKFGKQRIVHLHKSTTWHLNRYLSRRPRELASPYLFVSSRDRPPALPTVDANFRRCTRYLGMTSRDGSGEPRIHDFRHTFAIRSLAACGNTRQEVENHIVALSTYLGHASVRETYYYLKLLPDRTRELAELAGEEVIHGQD